MGKAYFVSGMGDECGSNCPAVDVYDDATRTWSVETLLSPRYEFTASAAPDGHGFVVVGGKQTKRSPWNLTEIFTQAAGHTSSTTANLPRSYHAASTNAPAEATFVGGGDLANGTVTTLVECFDWTKHAAPA